MIPRRVLPYLAIFLALLGLYFGLTWRQAREEAQKAEAKKIFQVKEGEIDALVLKRAKGEVHLARKNGDWFLTKPLQMRADKNTVSSILSTLAHLQTERDLGKTGDLKAYGLDKPALEVEFTAREKKGRLAIGNATPGKMGYYAYREQAPQQLLVINTSNKESLDRPEKDLRDKTLFTYAPAQVKSLRLKTPGTAEVQLDKVGPKSWRWAGREKFPVRGDRVDELVRLLHLSKIKEFVADAPGNLKSYGLAPPLGEIEITVNKEPQKLLLGKQAKVGGYARKAPDGPVVETDKELLALITKTLATLEDRRLWRGEAAAVRKMTWGPPDKTWVASKEKVSWKISGPGKEEFEHPAVLPEMGLWKLQALEFSGPASPRTSPAKPLYVLELTDGNGKSLFHLEELGREKDQVLVRVKAGEKTETGLVAQKPYQDFQKEMIRLASSPHAPRKGQGPEGGPGPETETGK